uniref:NAD-dependent epimerase/dehydratase domain-containing protein n=1 Tax=Ananas comosus var. bracteatus TaxID=296719 RepID=A0A6V7P419_ANACO|nr:unnamed protein product [Ananas comosus var. bracteatus]
MDGGPSCGHATAVPTTARMVREVAHGALWEDGQGEPVLSGVGGRCHPPHLPPLARQDSVPSTQHQERRPTRGPYQDVGSGELLAFPLSHLLPGQQVTPWSLFFPLSPDVYSDKIKHLLEPQPEHGRIQFHRLDIKNDYHVGSDPIQISAYCLPSFPLTLCCGITMQVKYCSENNKRLIHFSTCEVYGNAIGAFPQRITLCYRLFLCIRYGKARR